LAKERKKPRKTILVSKILVAIPTYNPSGHDHFHVWRQVIDSLVKQRKPNLEVDIVVCDNVSAQNGRDKLIEWQKEIPNLFLIFTEPRLPVHVCTNHAWGLMKHRGYDYYSYINSDVIHQSPDSYSILTSEMTELPDCAVISPQVNKDMCEAFNSMIFFSPSAPPTRLQVSQGVNGHTYLYTDEFMKAYDYRKPDVLWGHRTEPFISYQCAAIRKAEYLSHKVVLTHYRDNEMNIGLERKEFEFYDKPFETYGNKESFLLKMSEGIEYGIGFEEVYCVNGGRGIPETRKHKSELYEGGFPKDDRLYNWIKTNLFLTKEQLDYDKIKYESFGIL